MVMFGHLFFIFLVTKLIEALVKTYNETFQAHCSENKRSALEATSRCWFW